MYHRNITPFFVVFSIVVLLVILLASSLPWGEPQFEITATSPDNSPSRQIPHSLDPLVTPGPSR